jgi:hypothetical protein
MLSSSMNGGFFLQSGRHFGGNFIEEGLAKRGSLDPLC